MDPLTILSLVSAIVQFVDFGVKIVERLDEYNNGAKNVPEEFRSISNKLPLLINALKRIQSQATAGYIEKERAPALERTVDACLAYTKELEDILVKVLPSGNDSPWARRRKALSSFALANNVRSIEEKLNSCIPTLILDQTVVESSKGQVLQVTAAGTESHQEPCFTVKFARERKFVGREDIIKEIDRRFVGKEPRVAIAGIGGVGKSQIAIEYCYRYRQNHPRANIFWVHASNYTRFVEGYQEIASVLALPGHNNPEVDALQLVVKWLNDERNGPWLLVLDNADDIEAFFGSIGDASSKQAELMPKKIVGHLPECPNGAVLVTTRDKRVGERLSNKDEPIIVRSFEMRDSKLLLQQTLKKNDLKDGESEALLKGLEYLPMAITQAACYIRENDISVADYLKSLQANDQEAKDLLAESYYDPGRDLESQNSVFQTWRISFENIRKQKPRAADILSLMAFLDRQGVQERLLRKENEQHIDFVKAIGTLKAFSLITEGKAGAVFSMHRLVQLATQRWLELENVTREWQEKAFDTVCKCCPGVSDVYWSNWESFNPHIQVVLGYAVKTKPFLLARVCLLHGLANYNYYHGHLMAAEEKIREGCSMCEELVDDTHHLRRACTFQLAYVLQAQGKYVVAEAMYRQLLETTERAVGADHESSIRCLIALADILAQQHKWVACEETSYRVLARAERALGPTHTLTVQALGSVANFLMSQGQWEEAKAINKRAFEGNKNTLGDEHPFTLSSLARIISGLTQSGDFEAAEVMLKEAVDIHMKIGGLQNQDTLASISSLSLVLMYRGKNEVAKALNQQALTSNETILGADHPATLMCVIHAASLSLHEGNYEAAMKLYQRARDGFKKTLGPEHAVSHPSMEYFAFTLEMEQKYEEAESLRQQILAEYKKAYGPGHVRTLIALHNLAVVLGRGKKYELAEEMIHRVIDGFQKASGVDDPRTLNARRALASILGGQGKYDTAEALLRQVLKEFERVLGAENFHTIQTVNALAELLYSQEKYDESFIHYERAYSGYQKILGELHHHTQTCFKYMFMIEEWRRDQALLRNRYHKKLPNIFKPITRSWRPREEYSRPVL